MTKENVKLPVWAVILIWSLVGTIIGGGFVGGIAWGKATTDIENLKTNQVSYKDDFKQFKLEYREDFQSFKKEVLSAVKQ